MESNSIESTFCFTYLRVFIGIERSTIDTLVKNGYHSAASLRALDLDKDLPLLPNLSMGQRSILRDALICLKEEMKGWVREEGMTEPSLSGSFLESTPISKYTPYVNNSFKELVTTVMSKEVGGEEFLSQSNASITGSAAKQWVDSGINESALTLRPRKRRLSLNEMENTEKSTIKTIGHSQRDQTPNSQSSYKTRTSTSKRNNRFRLSTKKANKPKNNILSPKQTNSGRKTSIDINIDDSSQEMSSSDLSEGNSKSI